MNEQRDRPTSELLELGWSPMFIIIGMYNNKGVALCYRILCSWCWRCSISYISFTVPDLKLKNLRQNFYKCYSSGKLFTECLPISIFVGIKWVRQKKSLYT